MNDCVIVRCNDSFSIGKVVEILQLWMPSSMLRTHPDFITILIHFVEALAPKYSMPHLISTGHHITIDYKVIYLQPY